jgi:hypothetical protein
MVRRFGGLVLAAFLVVAMGIAAACGSGSSNATPVGDGGGDVTTGDGPGSLLGGEGGLQTLVVAPQNPKLTVPSPGTTTQFTATINGNPVTAQWTVDLAAIGTIDGTGLFTASGLLGGQTTIDRAGRARCTRRRSSPSSSHWTDNPGNVSAGTQSSSSGEAPRTPRSSGSTRTTAPCSRGPPGADAPVRRDGARRGVRARVLQLARLQGLLRRLQPRAGGLQPAALDDHHARARRAPTRCRCSSPRSPAAGHGPHHRELDHRPGQPQGDRLLRVTLLSPTDNGATMRIKPGAAQPDVLLGNCNVCHYVSADGSTIVATLDVTTPITSGAYDLKNNARAITQGNPTRLHLRRASTRTAASSWRAELRRRSPASRTMPVGRRTSTTRRRGPSSPRRAGTASSPTGRCRPSRRTARRSRSTTTTRARVTRSPSWTSTSRPHVLEPRRRRDGPDNFLGWPAFTPDGEWVVYDADSRSDFATWNRRHLGRSRTCRSPTSPSQTTVRCSRSQRRGQRPVLPALRRAAEGHMNYEPTVLPVAVGGYYWVVFTSRREYGNTINDADPYYGGPTEPRAPSPSARSSGSRRSTSTTPSTRARARTTSATRRSTCPARSSQTGNYRGFWALARASRTARAA